MLAMLADGLADGLSMAVEGKGLSGERLVIAEEAFELLVSDSVTFLFLSFIHPLTGAFICPLDPVSPFLSFLSTHLSPPITPRSWCVLRSIGSSRPSTMPPLTRPPIDTDRATSTSKHRHRHKHPCRL